MNKDYYKSLVSEARENKKTVVLTGLRGCGKTALMQEILAGIREERPPVRIIAINPEEGRWRHIVHARDLSNALKGLGIGSTAVFIDNADLIEDFETVLEAIVKEKGTRLFVTGQKSGQILGKVSSVLETKVQEIRIHPIGYRGFLHSRNLPDTSANLRICLSLGGLPAIVNSPAAFSGDYLEKTVSSLILDDIIEPCNIRDVHQFKMFLASMGTYTGNPVSTRTVCKWFQSRNMTIAPQTVLDFLRFTELSGMLHQIPVLDIQENRYISGSNVWYFGDTGIRSVSAHFNRSAGAKGKEEASFNAAIENAVFLSLLDDGWKIARGRNDTNRKNTSDRITFVCEKDGRRRYLQLVPPNCTDEARNSLINGLLAVRDGWEKILLDADRSPTNTNGIQTLATSDVLMET